jgi:glycosyltransferase involved in cell wall biosynthesis
VLAVTNLYPTPEAPGAGTFVEQQIQSLKDTGITVHVMFLDRDRKGVRAYFDVGRRVSEQCATFDADVVHVMYGGVLADQVTSWVTTKPVVVSFCGSDLLGELLSGSLRRLISAYGVRASHRAARRASAVVVKSMNLHNALPRGLDRSKVHIVPNGVNLEVFKPIDQADCRNRLGWRDDRLNVLFPTNGGDPRKRLPLALAAVELVSRAGIPVEVHQLRNVPHSAVPIWLNASDVVLLTSLHEGSPNIVKEALSCNVPVVSVDVGDVAERLTGIDGCHVVSANPSDLAAALSSVHSAKRRVASRTRMSELSLERIALRLKRLYLGLM